MEPTSRTPGGQVSKTVAIIGFAVALAVFCYPLYVRKIPLVPLWVAVQAKQNAPRVQNGMTDAQVWSTLGLSGRGLRAHVEGSGPSDWYPASYVLWPGYVISARWNLKTQPATLLAFKFQDRL